MTHSATAAHRTAGPRSPPSAHNSSFGPQTPLVPAHGADKTDQDFLDSLERRHPRAIGGVPTHVRLLRPAEHRAPEDAAAEGNLDIASGHFFALFRRRRRDLLRNFYNSDGNRLLS